MIPVGSWVVGMVALGDLVSLILSRLRFGLNLSKKQKEKAIEDEAREAARKEFDYQEGGSAGSSAKPSAAALPTKDCWKTIGDKLVRYHFVPRRELFSPDLTGLPHRIEQTKNRVTKIFPVGGADLVTDEDDWRNVRRRNKKFNFRWIGKTEFTILPPSPTSDESGSPLPEISSNAYYARRKSGAS